MSKEPIGYNDNYIILKEKWGSDDEWLTHARLDEWKDSFHSDLFSFMVENRLINARLHRFNIIKQILNTYQPVQSKQNPKLMMYYSTCDKMQRKVRTSAKPGTTFKKLFGFLNQQQIDVLVDWYKNTNVITDKGYDVVISKEAADFRSAYCDEFIPSVTINEQSTVKNLSNSCLNNYKYNFTGNAVYGGLHPVEVFAAGDIEIMIIKVDGKIAARTMFYINNDHSELTYAMIYAASDKHVAIIQSELLKYAESKKVVVKNRDNSSSFWFGAKIHKINTKHQDYKNYIIAPFIDVYSRYVDICDDDPNKLVILPVWNSSYQEVLFESDYVFNTPSALSKVRRIICAITKKRITANKAVLYNDMYICRNYAIENFRYCYYSSQYYDKKDVTRVYDGRVDDGSSVYVANKYVASKCRKITHGHLVGEYCNHGYTRINDMWVTSLFLKRYYYSYDGCYHPFSNAVRLRIPSGDMITLPYDVYTSKYKNKEHTVTMIGENVDSSVFENNEFSFDSDGNLMVKEPSVVKTKKKTKPRKVAAQ